MISPNAIKPERDPDMNPVDYWNLHGQWKDTIPLSKLVSLQGMELHDTKQQRLFARLTTTHMEVVEENPLRLPPNKTLSKFSVLCRLRFHHNYRSAMVWIEHEYLNKQIPYIRVGSDYYKVLDKRDRYGTLKRELKPWKKDEVKHDIGALAMNFIQKYDDFIIHPDNKEHSPVHGSYYNLFAPFNHTPAERVTDEDIPTSIHLMRHIFGEQLHLGLIYMKVLYELPRQALPILCLVSRERQTGKTTFLNWLDMIFGDNFVLVDPQVLTNDFNASYATKNIIGIDETVISDRSNAVERLKSISTQKSIVINQKHVSQYRLPFFGKVIVNSNKETEFMKIDSEEIRFWVRKVGSIQTLQTDIEERLWDEIPYFLRYLMNLPAVDTSQSRMVFTREQIATEQLRAVVDESKPTLYKELRILITDWFNQHEVSELLVSTQDIKEKWFLHNSDTGRYYIGKIIKDEFKLHPEAYQRYTPFYDEKDQYPVTKPGTPFRFKRSDFVMEQPIQMKVVGDPF